MLRLDNIKSAFDHPDALQGIRDTVHEGTLHITKYIQDKFEEYRSSDQKRDERIDAKMESMKAEVISCVNDSFKAVDSVIGQLVKANEETQQQLMRQITRGVG